MRYAGFWCRHDRLLRCSRSRNGRMRVRLCRGDGKRAKRQLVHRVVWRTFRGPIPEGVTINHMNGRPDDNRLENLELATPTEQMRHAYAIGLQRPQRGEARGPRVAKLTALAVQEIRALYHHGSTTYAALAARFGVSASCIYRIVRGHRWRHI